MDKRVSVLTALLLLGAAFLISCGGEDGCVELENENNFLLIFQGCPTDGIKQVCNDFECLFTSGTGNPGPPDLALIINPAECSRLGPCINLECDVRSEETGEIVGEVIFSVDQLLEANVFIGGAIINGSGGFEYTCSPVLL